MQTALLKKKEKNKMEGQGGSAIPEAGNRVPDVSTILYCRFCQQPFSSEARLNTHERIHTGVHGSYPCLLCGRGFSQAMYLKFHMQQIHDRSLEEAEAAAEINTMMQSCATNNTTIMQSSTIEDPSMLQTSTINDTALTQPSTIKDTSMVQSSTINDTTMVQSSNTILDTVVMAQQSNLTFTDEACDVLVGSSDISNIMDFAPLFHAEDLSLSFQEDGDMRSATAIPASVAAVSNTDPTDKPFPGMLSTCSSTDEEDLCREGQGSRKVRKQQAPRRTLPEQSSDVLSTVDGGGSAAVIEFTDEAELADDCEEMSEIQEGISGHHGSSSDQEVISGPLSSSSQPQITATDKVHLEDSGGVRTELLGVTVTAQSDSIQEPNCLSSEEDWSNPKETVLSPSDNIPASCHPAIKAEPFRWTSHGPYSSTSESVLSRCGADRPMVEPLSLPRFEQQKRHLGAGATAIPTGYGKKKTLVCDLCHQAFSGALFLRSHFRVAHGAEIIGIDSDEDENRIPPPMNVHVENSAFPALKRGRGRPKGSKTRPKLNGVRRTDEGKVKRPVGRPKGSKNKVKVTSNMLQYAKPVLQLAESTPPVKRGVGRPKGSKTRIKLPSDIVTGSITVPAQYLRDAGTVEKRRRGRPKGSRNKMKPSSDEVQIMPVKRGRGRPKGSKSNTHATTSSLTDKAPDREKIRAKVRKLLVIKNRNVQFDSSNKLIIVKSIGKADSRVVNNPKNDTYDVPVNYEAIDDRADEGRTLSPHINVEIPQTLSGKCSGESRPAMNLLQCEESAPVLKRGRGRPKGSKTKKYPGKVAKFGNSVQQTKKSKDVNISLSVTATKAVQHLKTRCEEDVSNEEIEPFIEKSIARIKEESPPIVTPSIKDEVKLEALTCKICGKVVARRSDMQRHMRTHTGEKPFPCKVCGRRFGDRSHLRDHLKLHSGERKYVCKVCGKAFAQSNGLFSHSQIHQEKQFGCKICEKKFTRKSDVQRHIRLHAGLKPVSCFVCQKKFANASNLNSHLKVHKEPSFSCETCERKFSRSSDLKRHRRTVCTPSNVS